MRFSRTLILCTLLLTLLSAIAYAKGPYRVAANESAIKFSLSHLTNRADGKFVKYEGSLAFNKTKPDASTINFSVDVASIDTGNAGRDDNLRGKEYFSVAEFPKMSFQSKAFKKVGDNRYMVTGTLTIKGHSKNISVPIVLSKTGVTWATGEDILRFQGNFQVDRTEFGVGESSKLLGSEVSVFLDLEFRGAK